MITAKEARDLSGPTLEEQVAEELKVAETRIREEATLGKRKLSLHGPFWAHEGYSKTEAYKMARQVLVDQGFDVDFFYEERQFVDMYTVVKW